VNSGDSVYESEYSKELNTIMFVTCYSEGTEGLKTTFDSLANTSYDDDYKLLFVVADGLITGSGNPKPTPQLVLDMLDVDPGLPFPPEPKSYIAVAEGSKKHNMAQVYAAWYNFNGHSVPTILVVKCGTTAEMSQPKPGNRGKRDSQMIMMNFYERVLLDEPMCALDYEIFEKMRYLMGITPDNFELILMVDADTKVSEDSLSKMAACMASGTLPNYAF
jgi:chitin synthase